MYLKRNDLVVVISGVFKNQQGRVLRVVRRRSDKKKRRDLGQDLVFVKGLKLVKKHIRRSQKNPQGGRIEKEAPFPASKLMLVDPRTNRPVRVGFRTEGSGDSKKKVRFSKKTQEAI